MMIQMGISCLLLTLTGLQLLTMSEILPFTVLARVEHLSYTFIDIFICCYRGEELMNEVRFNIYSSNIFRILFFLNLHHQSALVKEKMYGSGIFYLKYSKLNRKYQNAIKSLILMPNIRACKPIIISGGGVIDLTLSAFMAVRIINFCCK